jgi:putative inorganic carbon (hco3(-)) transporter
LNDTNNNTRAVQDQVKLKWVYALSGIFILVNTLLIGYEFYWFNIFPAIVLVALLALLSLDKLMYVIIFLTPLSVTLKDVEGFGVAISIPTEPMLFGVTLLFLFKYLYEGKYDERIMRHPVTFAVLFHLGWMLITTLTSEMPFISFKYFVARLWFVIPFYFVAIKLFTSKARISSYIWAYLISFTIVILYTIIRHAIEGFREQPAHVAMVPFYNDHTSYAAMLAMYLPSLFLFLKWPDFTRTQRLFTWILLILFIAATILSYTRAAWVSLFAALGVFLILKFRIRTSLVALMGAAVVVLFFVFENKILMKLEKNKKASSTDLADHFQSISNISTDASNLERINRWASAMRMFEERPFFGWGPGTYMFQYAPFQFSYEKTSISTNAGDRGNAHSEYIGPLAEQGVVGLLSIVFLIGTVFWCAVRLYKRLEDRILKGLVLTTMLGLLTYVVHGTLNNFLDTDKASGPFWGFIAIIVAVEIYEKQLSLKETTGE